MDVGGDGVGQGYYFAAGASAEVYKYECLFLVHSAMAEAPSFPSGLFYEPSGCEFVVVACGVGYEAGVLLLELQVLCCGDDGVFEETAGAACFFGSGEFVPADGGDEVGHLLGGGVVEAGGFEGVGKAFVAQVGGESGVQAEGYGPHDVASFELVFEKAIPMLIDNKCLSTVGIVVHLYYVLGVAHC